MNVISSTMKLAGLFRGWRRRSEDNRAAAESTRPAASAAPAVQPSIAEIPSAPSTTSPAFIKPTPPPARLNSEVELPLQTILEKLPQDLRTKMTMRISDLGDASISISTEQILPQLALGSAKITFGQLRVAAPELFRVAEEYDSLPIVLPLKVLLSQLNPNLLPRNPHQKSLEVPPEIKGPFGARAEGVSFATSLMKAPPSATPPTRMAPPSGMPKLAARAVAPPPPTFARPMTPAPRPAPIVPPTAPVIPPPPAPVAPAPSQQEISEPVISLRAEIPPVAPAPVVPPRQMTPITLPVAAPTPVQRITAPAAVSALTISTSLVGLTEKWPEPLKVEIQQMNLINAQVALPMNLVEPALKRGRIIFPWHNLRSWMTPRPTGASPNDSIELELPLKVVVPLFLECHPPVRPALRLSVDRAIPNLFFGFPSPEMEAPEPPRPIVAPIPQMPSAPPPVRATIPMQPPSPPPVQPVLPPVQPLPPSQPVVDTNFFAPSETLKVPAVDQSVYARSLSPDTELKKRLATPKEIVDRAMAIPGVVGAVVTLPDGLKVAAQVPPELNADTVAAFIPQIFERVGQSTRELRMGALNNLKFTVGNVPWKIFRVNAVYFAAFGRAGERLPTAELAQLAVELDRKIK